MYHKIKEIFFQISAILVVIGAALPIFIQEKWVPYIFTAGAVGMCIVKLISPYRGNNFRLRRLILMELLGTLMLLFASYLMIQGGYDWVVLLAISAFLQLYTSLIIPRELKKEQKEEKKKE